MFAYTDPYSVCDALVQNSARVPVEDLVLRAVVDLPFTQTGISECVQGAAFPHPQHTAELQQ